jgi:hypothetical protein
MAVGLITTAAGLAQGAASSAAHQGANKANDAMIASNAQSDMDSANSTAAANEAIARNDTRLNVQRAGQASIKAQSQPI